ncbi:MAG: terminase family protein [Planctomycetales bacterium]|nr:terminase family protein [Planctomycetales bacterium]
MATSSKSLKAKLADVVVDKVRCRACGEPRKLDDFRLFKASPDRVYMDFCVHCEKVHGTLTLYRRYNAYGTREIIDAVFAAAHVVPIRRTPEQVRLLVEANPAEQPASNEDVLRMEMERRELSRRNLMYFTTQMMPEYKPGWVHQDICRRLMKFVRDVESGLSPRLMICMPPRHGKSQLASDMFPSWVLGLHPEWNVIASSYAQSLPLGFSRNIRDRLNDPEYQAIFGGTKLRPDAKGIEEWKTTKGGGYIAAGVGTGITGKGYTVGIMDDPIKDQEEADSDVIRAKTYAWYQSVFRTRVAPGGGILIINTRWHWADPSGLLLDTDEQLAKAGVPPEERENWDVISYPALAEGDEYLMRNGRIETDPAEPETALRLLRKKGEALHPERYAKRELIKIRNGMSASIWNALYQQRPTPEEGDFFKRDDFCYRWLDPAFRPLLSTFMTVDYAIGQKQRNDFTVMGCWALDWDDNLFLLEVRRGRWKTDDIVSNAVAMVERHKPSVYAGERGQIHMAVWPLIEAELANKRLYPVVDDSLLPMQDKEIRARPLQARMQRRKLFFSYEGATKPEDYDRVEKELLQFPNGAHDDCVDMMAWAARLALNMPLPRRQQPKKHKSWKDTLRSLANDSTKSAMSG